MAWVKPGAWGLVIGSLVTMIVGFAWGGWVTARGADRVAIGRSGAAVVAVCM